jgi:hypothetical protein
MSLPNEDVLHGLKIGVLDFMGGSVRAMAALVKRRRRMHQKCANFPATLQSVPGSKRWVGSVVYRVRWATCISWCPITQTQVDRLSKLGAGSQTQAERLSHGRPLNF